MQRLCLNGTWELYYGPAQETPPNGPEFPRAGGWPCIDAQIPGNVELDLLRAGKLPDLTRGNNIYALLDVEGNEWWYRRTFAEHKAAAGRRVELVFEGLDCLATVWLNGREVGSAENMLIPHHFDVTEALRGDGENELVVRIRSAVVEGRKRKVPPGEWAIPSTWEGLNVRKAPHMYGWDIMPRVVSAGLWRDVYLQAVEPCRFESVYWRTKDVDADRRTAKVKVDWRFAADPPAKPHSLRLVLTRNGKTVHEGRLASPQADGSASLELRDVDLWWPLGFGQAALHEASLELLDAAGRTLARHACRVGLRTIELRRTDITSTEKPGEFVFLVNGRKIFIKGTNWVPLDSFPSRHAQHVKRTFDLMKELNCNMVRCWGGNVYEDHEFFDLCDEHGVMVWQDFAMACGVYPQTDEFAEKLGREARSVVQKLRNHPSLALWAGVNEGDDAYVWSNNGGDPNVDRPTRQVLPEVLRRLDPDRPYLPSSPYRSPSLVALGPEASHTHRPEDHLWGPRNDFKGSFYTTSAAHFVSEIGYHGCPCRASLEQMFDPEFLWPWQDNDQWLTRAVRPVPSITAYNYRIPLMAKQIEVLFGQVPDNLEDFILMSQISQAEANKYFLERWRSGKWRRTGMLWWNLRDGWPVISDAVVDYYYRRKLAFEYIRRVQTDCCAIVCEAEGGRHRVVVVNDTLRDQAGQVTLRDTDSGTILLEAPWRVEANGLATVGEVQPSERPAMWILDTRRGEERRLNHYLAGSRPFCLRQYRQWMQRLELPAEITSLLL